MTTVSVVIPTIRGREEYAARCLQGYRRATSDDVTLDVCWVHDQPTCGLGWQKGAELASGDYIHLSADDIVPASGWLRPLVEACDQGKIPCALVLTPTADMLDENEMPREDAVVLPGQRHFFERHPSDESVVPDWYVCQGDSEYPAIPFMSRDQWNKIGPMIVSQYGGDKYVGYRARQLGMAVVARHGSAFYHYAALAGRVDPSNGWMHTDRLDFDLNIAWPEYISGRLAPTERHPLDLMPEGRALARSWRMSHLPGPHPWELEQDPAYH